MQKRVLLVDLDPQANATIRLLGEDKWLELNNDCHTVAQLFKDAVNAGVRKFDLAATLQNSVSNVYEARSLDLLPSSLDLLDVQDQLASALSGKVYAPNSIELLWSAVKSKLDDYDIVIVDCPPHLGVLTFNGLRISNGYIIPAIPDCVATQGIPQIVTRIDEFANAIGKEIRPLGIVIAKFEASSTVHNTVLKQLQQDPSLPEVFSMVIRQSNSALAAAEFLAGKRTLWEKYGADPNGLTSIYIALAEEVLDKLDKRL